MFRDRMHSRTRTPPCPWAQRYHHSRRGRRWRPSGDAPGALPRLLVVGDAGEPAAQFNRGRKFTILLIGGADRGGIGFGDNKHGRRRMVGLAGNSQAPSERPIFDCLCILLPPELPGKRADRAARKRIRMAAHVSPSERESGFAVGDRGEPEEIPRRSSRSSLVTISTSPASIWYSSLRSLTPVGLCAAGCLAEHLLGELAHLGVHALTVG